MIDESLLRDDGTVTSTSPAMATDVAFTPLEELTSTESLPVTGHGNSMRLIGRRLRTAT